MTRKDYVMLSDALKATAAHHATDPDYREGWHAATSSAAHRIADALQRDNARFDRARFLAACGVAS